VDLPDAVGHPAFPQTLEALIHNHRGTVLDVARESLEREDVLELAVTAPRLLAPLLPDSIRSFRAFGGPAARRGSRAHAAASRPWYARREHRAVLGPDQDLAWPAFSRQLDFECHLGCVIGAWGRDLTPAEAGSRIFGFVLVNDWVARDVEAEERAAGTGPGKSRDFATSIGPCLVTADELDLREVRLSVRVDGEEWAAGEAADMRWPFAELAAFASEGEELWPGDLLTSGPFAGGCGADLGRCPPPGAVVEIEGSGIGTLRTKLGRPAPEPFR
jgi:2-keto-4-pentenoate hydratase/2-oxohepta-3-ene-1,7-dioic acid hydratase in catechol pathway